MIIKLNGPPGTGKTTYIVDFVSSLINQGKVDPLKVYALSFSRAARESLIKKFRYKGIYIKEDNIRTLHSFAYKELGLSMDKCDLTDIEIFFTENGLSLTSNNTYEDVDETIFGEEVLGDKIYHLINLRRLHMGDNDWIYDYAHLLPYQWDPTRFNRFFNEFLGFLKKSEVYDYTRMLEVLLSKKITLSGEVLIVDEAQDLSLLQMEIIKKLIPNFDYVIFAGDVDQAIFDWAGSDPSLMLNLEANKKINLTQSYRLPESICNVAKRVIEKNFNREPIDYKPVNKKGKVDKIDNRDLSNIIDHALKNGEKVFILTRHRFLLADYKKLLKKKEIDYDSISKVAFSSSSVFLGTIHRSKGLEAENVILDLRVSNKVENLSKGKEVESERRVLYVGLTRAKERLFLINHGHTKSYLYEKFLS